MIVILRKEENAVVLIRREFMRYTQYKKILSSISLGHWGRDSWCTRPYLNSLKSLESPSNVTRVVPVNLKYRYLCHFRSSKPPENKRYINPQKEKKYGNTNKKCNEIIVKKFPVLITKHSILWHTQILYHLTTFTNQNTFLPTVKT